MPKDKKNPTIVLYKTPTSKHYKNFFRRKKEGDAIIVMVSLKFKEIGWISKIQKRKHTFFISIAKLVAIGSLLKNGDKAYSYTADIDGRNAIITYLDGEPREKGKEISALEYNSFIER